MIDEWINDRFIKKSWRQDCLKIDKNMWGPKTTDKVCINEGSD